MPEAYIVDVVCTPTGRRGGSLSDVHPADLGAEVLRVLMECTGIDPHAVDIARTCWLAAGLPEEVPGTTIDRQYSSAQQPVSFAPMAIKSGVHDVVVAGGVQQMQMIPIASAMMAAEPIAEKWGSSDTPAPGGPSTPSTRGASIRKSPRSATSPWMRHPGEAARWRRWRRSRRWARGEDSPRRFQARYATPLPRC